MTKFLLIRHATTSAVGKRLSGRKPAVHLNDHGLSQVSAIAASLVNSKISAIYTSPLERAIQTAAPIAQRLELTPQIEKDLQEIDFGDWTDKSFDALATDQHFSRFNAFRSGTRIPGGEMMLEAQIRIVRVMQALSTKHPEATVALVSHSDIIKAALAYYAGIPLDMMQRLEISPASVSVLDLYTDFASLQLLNFTGQLQI